MYNFFWKRDGEDDKLPLFQAAQNNNLLIVTIQEHEQMLMVAEEHAAPRCHFQGPKSVPVQINKKGVLQQNRKRKLSQCQQPPGTAALHAAGGLVQDIHIPESKLPVIVSPPRTDRNMDIEDRLAKEVKDIATMLQDNPAAIEQLWSTLAALKANIARAQDSVEPALDLEKMVSFAPIETRSRYKRLKAQGEPDRKMMAEMKQPATTRMTKGQSSLDMDWM